MIINQAQFPTYESLSPVQRVQTTSIARAMELERGEIVEWVIENDGNLKLLRLAATKTRVNRAKKK
jgi:hypothetical protein